MDMDTGDDGGGGGDMAEGMDPSLMDQDNPLGGMMGMGGAHSGMKGKMANLRVQTLLALQELGIVVAVAFLVGIIFMLMIFVEKMWDRMTSAIHRRMGGIAPIALDSENPAALVGTFKRYKN